MPILEKKEERSQINYLLFHFKKLEKEEPNKLDKQNRGNNTKFRMGINAI